MSEAQQEMVSTEPKCKCNNELLLVGERDKYKPKTLLRHQQMIIDALLKTNTEVSLIDEIATSLHVARMELTNTIKASGHSCDALKKPIDTIKKLGIFDNKQEAANKKQPLEVTNIISHSTRKGVQFQVNVKNFTVDRTIGVKEAMLHKDKLLEYLDKLKKTSPRRWAYLVHKQNLIDLYKIAQ